MPYETHHGEAGERTAESHIQLPAPTFWPIIFAFGLTLLASGLVTHWSVSVVGFILVARGIIGWWYTVIPHEEHEEVLVDPKRRPAPIEIESRSVVRLTAGVAQHRVRIPETIHPYSAGVWGGLAGGAAMAGLAVLYGLVAEHSIWYPVNLLAGAVIPQIGVDTLAQLRVFSAPALIAAILGHVTLSILVGIVYATILPMFPKYAPFWAGILMPLFWSALVAVSLNLLNPALVQHINWPWFVVCQLAYGLVGGFFIARSTSISTMQSWSFAERAFLHAPGISVVKEDHGGEDR